MKNLPKVSVSREALATVTNLKNLPYEGFAYDKIMMNTYKALNYLELGDFERARVELNRAYERQKDAIHINSKRIEKALDEGKNKTLTSMWTQSITTAAFKASLTGITQTLIN